MAQTIRFSVSISPQTVPSLSNRDAAPLHIRLPIRRSVPVSASHSHSPPSVTVSDDVNPSSIVHLVANEGVVAELEVDKTMETELKENGTRSSRRTKLVCTIGPATCGFNELEALATSGMNVARLNMCHGTQDWHRAVIERVRRLNETKGFAIAIMMDTQGSEIYMGDLGGPSSVKAEDGDVWNFSVRSFNSSLPERTITVNYDGFAEDVRVGDEIIVDGGMARFEVVEKIGPDVRCCCNDPGLLLPRANLTIWRDGRMVQERNSMLPTISSKDWLDIDFGIAEGVDFVAISFVKSAEVINHLKSYIAARSCARNISVIAKIESGDSLKNLEEIIQASDGVMVARGDLGAQIPLEHVPSAQDMIVKLCRQLNKPVIVASQLLESMIEYPIPTRAEVADVSEAVREQTDALMLSGESAMGQYPEKALSMLRSISLRIEKSLREEKQPQPVELLNLAYLFPDHVQEELCNVAARMADNLKADALLVYTKTGQMASLLSRCRPDCPIFAFTPSISVQRNLNLRWGVIPFSLSSSENLGNNLEGALTMLKDRGMIKSGETLVSVSDALQSVQVLTDVQDEAS